MSKILVLYYSTTGHVETMAEAVAEGARSAGASVDVKRVLEIVPRAVAEKGHFKLDEGAPVVRPADSANYDATIVGTPTRYDVSPRRWWRSGTRPAASGPIAPSSARSARPSPPRPRSTAAKRRRCSRSLSNLLRHGMVITGQPYSFKEQMTLDEIASGSPYGATTIAGGDGSRT